MRRAVFLLGCSLLAQAPDPAYEPLRKAYEALRGRQYDQAVAGFQEVLAAAPARTDVRKDLAYTYLRIGENEAARNEFRAVMRLAPEDWHAALEYAYLASDTGQVTEARRVFDRVRKAGDPVSRAAAATAFENLDGPLREGIERWKQALAGGAGGVSAHYELATLAERRDDLELAARHYEQAWRLVPQKRWVLVNLGRVWKGLGRGDEATAALLAASRGGEAWAAETAREILPERYPYVPEFRKALELDPANIELRRELGYLLLKMERQQEAEEEFRIITAADQSDLLSAAQLGFLYVARGDRSSAMPLLERVLRGADEELANRVRAVLRMPQAARRRMGEGPVKAVDAREMAERSLRAGYLKDALKYLTVAQEADPADFNVMLRLGWTYNLLKEDSLAMRWFGLARRSPDVRIAAEGTKGYQRLRRSLARVAVSGWAYPIYSTRWRDLFSYGQVKAELRTSWPVRPYASLRFVGDTRGQVGSGSAVYLSENAAIGALGISTPTWQGWRGWAEAGVAAGYLSGKVLSDYRAGISWFRGVGRQLGSDAAGWFAESGMDAVFVSRYGRDVIGYMQNRYGYTWPGLQMQLYCNSNITRDTAGQYWANFYEFGPGTRFLVPAMPESLMVSLNVLRGVYANNEGNPRRPNFFDFRAGFGYGFRY
jgi:tetratricopeptide (TPR) repeat protein